MALYSRCLKCSSNFTFTLSYFRQFGLKCLNNGLQAQVFVSNQAPFHSTAFFNKRRKNPEEKKNLIEYPAKAKGEFVEVWRGITVKQFSSIMGKNLTDTKLLFLNQIEDVSEPIFDIKLLQQAVRRGGKRMRIIGDPAEKEEEVLDKDVFPRPPPSKDQLKPRPPVVTVMGHVDHGKTTLLDALRHSSVVDQEFGGITQHIGAFSVRLGSGATITFLDTPGHAAFSAMRARGANVTDVVVLVVAADDGVMEQTVESIKMAKSAQVPILVAINKIDAPKANIERTRNMLAEIGIQVESLGGDIQSIPISALKKQNLDQLTEALLLQAELLEVGADPTGNVEATVLESKLHPHRGKLCTVIVQRGTLRKGAVLVAGTCFGKVRALKDDNGKILNQVMPGYPAEIEGWKELPQAGDLVLEVESEKKARSVIKIREQNRNLEKSEEEAKIIAQKAESHQKEYKERLQLKRSLGKFKMRSEGPRKKEIIEVDDGIPSLNFIVKGDVNGTLEAILDAFETYNCDNCKLDLISYGVGAITETDIELAKTFNGIIYAFNVPCPPQLKSVAEDSQVVIKHHNVIYKLIDDVKKDINSKLPLKEVEETLGEAVVLQQFEISKGKKKVPVAGSKCIKGNLKRSAMFRLVRKGQVIYEGPLSSMRHLKSEVDLIKEDTECGLQLEDSAVSFEKDDILICFEKKMLPQVTEWNPGF